MHRLVDKFVNNTVIVLLSLLQFAFYEIYPELQYRQQYNNVVKALHVSQYKNKSVLVYTHFFFFFFLENRV